MRALEKLLCTANQFHRQGALEDAAKTYRSILARHPGHAQALHGLGIIAFQMQDYKSAAGLLGKAIAAAPATAGFYYNLGLVFAAAKKIDSAVDAFGHAARLDPADADTRYNLGKALKTIRRFEEAAAQFGAAIKQRPDFAEAHFNLGNSLRCLGRFEQAAASFKQALKLKPNYAEAYNNLGLVFKDSADLENALCCYNRAIELAPEFAEAHWNRSLANLLSGNLAKGWQEYEWRFKRGKWQAARHRFEGQPRWEGAPFEGQRLMVRGEQGLGDNLQFVRYLPMVKERGGTVIFETSPLLESLLRDFPGIDELVASGPGKITSPAYDFQIPLLSLPRIFATQLQTIPAEVPYLYAAAKKARLWQARLEKTGLRVGVVWAGRPEHENDPNRSCPLKHFISLSKIEGLHLYGLQKGPAARQVKVLPRGIRLVNLGDELDDFSDTAAVIENLDLVVSVDTAVAHLAGAMAKPVWVLLPFVPDWRWLMQREDSPWYPTMRLFRQRHRGDWAGVINRMITELADSLNSPWRCKSWRASESRRQG